MYEIVVFEHNTIYDSSTADSSDKAVKMFVEMCGEFVSPEYVPENETSFNAGQMFLSYADRSGGDKPMLVLLIGTITDEMESTAEEMLKKLYIRICEDCNVAEIPITQGICKACSEI